MNPSAPDEEPKMFLKGAPVEDRVFGVIHLGSFRMSVWGQGSYMTIIQNECLGSHVTIIQNECLGSYMTIIQMSVWVSDMTIIQMSVWGHT